MTSAGAPRHTGPLVYLDPPRTWGELSTVMKIACGTAYDFYIRQMVTDIVHDFREKENRILHLLSHPAARATNEELPSEVITMVKQYLQHLLLYPQREVPCVLREFLHERRERGDDEQ